MLTSNNKIFIVVMLIIIAMAACWFINRDFSFTPTINVITNTVVKATTVQVGTFYDGKDGYSLSIPGGNSSTCIWTYEGGSGAIPGSETTNARSATDKHIIYIYDLYDWKVSCVDDFGNQYVGIFPNK